MPSVPFETMPDDARLWVFAAERELTPRQEGDLLKMVDDFLAGWQAHGVPLRCARNWQHHRFLAIAVDQHTEGASGCSIDGLFRVFKSLEPKLGTSLTAGGRVFYRDQHDAIRSVSREEFEQLGESGAVNARTPVFDASITAAGAWRSRFEVPAGESWQGALIGAGRK